MDAEFATLVNRAEGVLRANDLGAWTKPAPNLYPHQWNWDSAFIAIGLSHGHTERAQTEVLSLLRGQWSNGLVPQIVFNPKATGYFPGPDVWQSERSPNAPRDVATSGITQPPVLSTAVLAIWRNAADQDAVIPFLRRVYPHLLAYHRFLYSERNPDGDGLIVVVHPWESGLDNSPPYLDAGQRVKMTYKPTYTRLDTQHVSARNRPSDKDYDLYVYLLEQMRAQNWDQRAYLRNAPLQVQDVLFNSILCRADRDLAEIAHLIGEDSTEVEGWREQTIRAINAKLWSDEDQTYYSYDRVAQRLLTDDTIAGFGPLYGGAATSERASRLIELRLTNPREYWPDGGYPVPTTALDSSWFDAENYWRGPVWIATNWLLIHGLVTYAETALAGRLTTLTIDLPERNGFREYYSPYSGEGFGTDSFSWSAALTIDLVTALESISEPGEPGLAGTT